MTKDKRALTPSELEEVNRRLTEKAKKRCEHMLVNEDMVCASCGVYIDEIIDEQFDDTVGDVGTFH